MVGTSQKVVKKLALVALVPKRGQLLRHQYAVALYVVARVVLKRQKVVAREKPPHVRVLPPNAAQLLAAPVVARLARRQPLRLARRTV